MNLKLTLKHKLVIIFFLKYERIKTAKKGYKYFKNIVTRIVKTVVLAQ